MQGIVFFNGKFLSPEARALGLEPGLILRFGLFETMRSYKMRIVYLDWHLERIRNSAKLLGMRLTYSFKQLRQAIKKIIQLNHLQDAYLRLTIWKQGRALDILLVAKEYKPYPARIYRRGFSVKIAQFRQCEGSPLAQLKTTERLVYELSFQEARHKGFDEAIMLNSRGVITEGTRSNIFLVKQGEILTPSLSCGCLDGITRKVIFALALKYKLKIYEGKFSPQDLYEADEAFLTNSLMGVMPLYSLERKIIGKGKCGKLTRFFIEKYNCLLR